MNASSRSAHHLIVPDEVTTAQAANAVRTLKHFREQHPEASSASLMLSGNEDATAEVPVEVLDLLILVLAQAASGNAVAVSPVKRELTTQQAADLLNVSRPYLVKLLDQRRIPFRRVGNRRRLLLTDVMAFKHVDESERRAIAAELTADGQHYDPEGDATEQP